MIGRAAMSSLAGAAAILTATNLLPEPAQAAQGFAQPQLSFTCGFTSGPRTGQTQSYAGVAGIEAAPVGTHCADGQGSIGRVIPEVATQPPAPAPPPPPPTLAPTTFICRFDNGPRAGQVQSYAGVTGMRGIAVGAQCTDGQGSTGVAIAQAPAPPPVPVQPAPAPAVPARTSACGFETGPRAGQVQNYLGVTGMQPMLVGRACTDGQGGTGIAIPQAAVQPAAAVPPPPAPPPPVPALTSTCRFDAGPRAGQAQSYAGMTGIPPMRVGRQCANGQGSMARAIPDVPVPPAAAVELRRAPVITGSPGPTIALPGVPQSLAAQLTNLERVVLIDAGSARLFMIEHGRTADSMRVVVGGPKTPTPSFRGVIHDATINPYWNVPAEIAASLIAPQVLRKGVSYLDRQGYEVVSEIGPGAHVVAPGSVDWKAVAAGTADVQIRQLPRWYNSMGRMKFDIANADGIYLHDTPNKKQFAHEKRNTSHGCVRLEDAPRLARWLLGRDLELSSSAPEQHVQLPAPVPIIITYLDQQSDSQPTGAIAAQPTAAAEVSRVNRSSN